MRRIFFSILIFTTALSSRAGAPALTLGLGDALALAKKQNANVLIAEEKVKQALARESQTRGVLLPQLSVAVSETRQTINLAARGIDIPHVDPIVGPFDSFDARVRISQTIYDRAASRQATASRAARTVSMADSEKSREDALALVGTLFINARRARASEKLARTLVARDEERFRLARARLKSGTGSQLDLERAQSQVDDGRNRLFDAEKQAVQRQLDLKTALGLSAEESIAFKKEATMSDVTPPTEEAVRSAVKNHPDVVSAHHRLEWQRAQLDSTEGDAYPKFGAAADYGASGKEIRSSHATYTLGLNLSAPIYQGGQHQARVREQTSLMRESEIALADTERRVAAAALAARQELQQALELVQARINDRAVAEKEVGVSRHRLATGWSSKFEALNASAQASVASDQLDEAAAAVETGRINLAHALGQMETLIKENAP